MFEEIKKNYNLIRILLLLLIVAVGTYVFGIVWEIIGRFSNILVVLIISWLLAFILEPLVMKVQVVTKLPKIWSTLTVYVFIAVLFALVILLFIPIATTQIKTLTTLIPHYLTSFPAFITSWGEIANVELKNSITLIPSVAQFLFSVFIVLILSFYFIVDKEKMNQELLKLTPKDWHDHIAFMQKLINDTFVSFLRIQLFYGISTALLTWIVLFIFGVDFAVSIAFLAGLLAIIPLVGPPVALIPPVVASFVASPLEALIVGAILLFIQQIQFNIVGPKLYGNAFKLHPAIILISFLVGFEIAGGIGAIFAIPVFAISAVVIRNLSHYFLHKEQLW